ncbi:hypothetical protein ACIGKR_29900 [Rhodococcus qingshengii]|uniref:hypothetical protein n=1 Tax=Rhodococcus qingshengii TaxID=334542 RepID=UPI0037C63BE2
MESEAHILVHAGTPITGGWCEVCQLPSLITVPALTIDGEGVNVVGHIKICDEHEVIDDGG